MKKKYHSEKELFGDRTIIYDEHGNKVGYGEKSIFGNHVNIYDSKGNKIGRQEESFFGDHVNVYDSKGNKIGESYPSFWGTGSDYYSKTPSSNQSKKTQSYSYYESYTQPVSSVPREIISQGSNSTVSKQEIAQICHTTYTLTADEAIAYGKLCAELLTKAGIRANQTTYRKEEYEEKVHYGFLNLKTRKTTKTKYVPDEEGWCLKQDSEITEYNTYERDEVHYTVLTKSGTFYSGERREHFYYGGGYSMVRNDWVKMNARQLVSVIPLMDLFLKNNNIPMSSNLYWTQLHPQSKTGVPKDPSRAEYRVTNAPVSKGKQFAYTLTVSKAEDINILTKAIRSISGCGLKEGRLWAESSQNIILQTNDKNEAIFAIDIFEDQYGIPVTINGHQDLTKRAPAQYDIYQKTPVKLSDPCPCGSGLKYKHCCGKKA